MRSAGIVCEYNPFHKGHENQIKILRNMGFDCIVCVMSGNFTQRGELAIADKYTRAKMAIAGGADLVLELPFPFSSLSAEGFARSGVHVLGSVGVDALSFGSECADISALKRAAEAVLSDEFADVYAKISKSSSKGSATAYFEAIKQLSGEDTELLSNDILAISYLCAIERAGFDMEILPVKRDGSGYNDTQLCNGRLPSASAIRENIKTLPKTSNRGLEAYIPQAALDTLNEAEKNLLAPVISDAVGNDILSFFKLMTPEEIVSRAAIRSGGGAFVCDDGCGICERLCRCARSTHDFVQFLEKAYTAKYTKSRINRVILFSLLGVSDKMEKASPQYTTILAASPKGREFLSQKRKIATFPTVTKPADAPKNLSDVEIAMGADSLYASAMPSARESEFFVKASPYMSKE